MLEKHDEKCPRNVWQKLRENQLEIDAITAEFKDRNLNYLFRK